jgi:hypothetical protein
MGMDSAMSDQNSNPIMNAAMDRTITSLVLKTLPNNYLGLGEEHLKFFQHEANKKYKFQLKTAALLAHKDVLSEDAVIECPKAYDLQSDIEKTDEFIDHVKMLLKDENPTKESPELYIKIQLAIAKTFADLENKMHQAKFGNPQGSSFSIMDTTLDLRLSHCVYYGILEEKQEEDMTNLEFQLHRKENTRLILLVQRALLKVYGKNEPEMMKAITDEMANPSSVNSDYHLTNEITAAAHALSAATKSFTDIDRGATDKKLVASYVLLEALSGIPNMKPTQIYEILEENGLSLGNTQTIQEITYGKQDYCSPDRSELLPAF